MRPAEQRRDLGRDVALHRAEVVEEQLRRQRHRVGARELGRAAVLAGVWFRETLSVWVSRYSVGLNMHSISVLPAGLLLPTQTSLALSGLSSPSASPTALTRRCRRRPSPSPGPQNDTEAETDTAPAIAPPSASEAEDLLVGDLQGLGRDVVAHHVQGWARSTSRAPRPTRFQVVMSSPPAVIAVIAIVWGTTAIMLLWSQNIRSLRGRVHGTAEAQVRVLARPEDLVGVAVHAALAVLRDLVLEAQALDLGPDPERDEAVDRAPCRRC